MIKALIRTSHGPIGFLGLTRENLDRLQDGRPIVVDLGEIEMEGRVVITFGETADDVVEALQVIDDRVPDMPDVTPEHPVAWYPEEER